MKKSTRYSSGIKERAIRLVHEHRSEHSCQWSAIVSIASKIGCTPETLREWIKQHDIDTGTREGLSSSEPERIKQLEREVRELSLYKMRLSKRCMSEGHLKMNSSITATKAHNTPLLVTLNAEKRLTLSLLWVKQAAPLTML